MWLNFTRAHIGVAPRGRFSTGWCGGGSAGTDGSTFVTRVQATGYTAPVGENIAWGWRTPADVMNAWMNSAPHKANILNCSARAIGVGLAYASNGTSYWTQEFGSR